MKENEKMRLKNKFLFGRWISIAAKVYRHDKIIKKKNLPRRFEDWIYRECGIKKQTIYNHRNLCKLMSVVPKLLHCQVNMTYFVKKYETLMGYFEENEQLIPWKHHFNCECENCNSYFFEKYIQVHLNWKLSLNRDLITEPIFCNIFSINNNLLQTNIRKIILFWHKIHHDLIYEHFGS